MFPGVIEGFLEGGEGYKDLLVHGPLLATVALDELRKNINCKLTEFEFRMLKPVLVNEEINLKIFKNSQNKKEFKIIFTCFKKKEVKFIAFCKSKWIQQIMFKLLWEFTIVLIKDDAVGK